MVKQTSFVIITFISLCLSISLALAQAQLPDPPALSSFVDRTQVSLNESFTLTIRIDSKLDDSSLSLSTLNRDFDQIGISKLNNYTNNNGTVQSWSEYNITLRPKSTGTLTIPAFRVGSSVSLPISITVNTNNQSNNTANNDIFLTTSISKDNIYVQEQLLYTIKLYFSVNFDQGAVLTTPQVSNAVVQQFGIDNTYQEIIDGIRYNVNQRDFVIYPQSSGEITIPPVNFVATVGRRRNGLNRLLNNRNSSSREINLFSDPHTVDVEATPAGFPGRSWLPTTALTIAEDWSGDLSELIAGQAITRNIVVTAAGLSSTLLPDIDYPVIEDLKFYPDQALREDSSDENGVVGIRTEGTAIVASAPGEYLLPEISIPWWNTSTNSLEIALIPERILKVSADPSLPAPPPQTPTEPIIDPVAAPTLLNNPAAANNESTEFSENSVTPSNTTLPWVVSVLLACAWLFTTAIWLRDRRLLHAATVISTDNSSGNNADTSSLVPLAQRDKLAANTNSKRILPSFATRSASLRSAQKHLQDCCQQKSPLEIKHALLSWAQVLYNSKTITNLEQIKRVADDDDFLRSIEKLEKALYSESSTIAEFDSRELLKAAQEVQNKSKSSSTKGAEDYSLPPLYKN